MSDERRSRSCLAPTAIAFIGIFGGALLWMSPSMRTARSIHALASSDADAANGAFHEMLKLGRLDLACPEPRELTLLARCKHNDYERACAGFQWGGRATTKLTRNHWDLLFGNNGLRSPDELSVRMVVGDQSTIADVGSVSLADATCPPEPDARWSDRARVVLGHTYVVRTLWNGWANADVVTAFTVTEHAPNDRVKLSWRIVDVRRIE